MTGEPVVAGTSRVELEPLLARALDVGDDDLAAEILVELAGRTWQWTNPYLPS